jgi:hypothetical protein
VDAAARSLAQDDLEAIHADLAEIREVSGEHAIGFDGELGTIVVDEEALDRLTQRDWSPLGALEQVSQLLPLGRRGPGRGGRPALRWASLEGDDEQAVQEGVGVDPLRAGTSLTAEGAWSARRCRDRRRRQFRRPETLPTVAA